MTKLAFLGLGQMGEPMARRLLQAGHDLTVWNRTRSRADALVGEGAAVARLPGAGRRWSGRGVSPCSRIPPRSGRSVLEPDGLASGLASGSVLVEMSTVGPDAIRELASRLPEGVGLLDAPVLGSVPARDRGLAQGSRRRRPGDVRAPAGGPGGVRPDDPCGPELGAGASMKLVANSTLGVGDRRAGRGAGPGRPARCRDDGGPGHPVRRRPGKRRPANPRGDRKRDLCNPGSSSPWPRRTCVWCRTRPAPPGWICRWPARHVHGSRTPRTPEGASRTTRPSSPTSAAAGGRVRGAVEHEPGSCQLLPPVAAAGPGLVPGRVLASGRWPRPPGLRPAVRLMGVLRPMSPGASSHSSP